MGSTSTRHAEDLNAEQDRISNLPGCLISHILSFLPTKNVVATSVLSTKWKELWTLTTSLVLSDNDSTEFHAYGSSLETSFTRFMYRVLQYDRFPCLRKFELSCDQYYGDYHVYAWVDFALKHNVQELDLWIPETSPMLPRSLFTCRTLVKLSLDTRSVMMAHTQVVFPCLKDLGLLWFTFPDDHSITSFFSGCPVLENLSIAWCLGKCVKVVNISAPRLTTLQLYHLPAEQDTSMFNYKIVLNTPCLSKLTIKLDIIAQEYDLKVLPHLKRALIYFVDKDAPATYSDIHRRAVNDLLKGISRVEFLELDGDESIEENILCNCQPPTFQNLTHLLFRFRGASMLPEFLRSSPLLRSLSFSFSFRETQRPNWNPPDDVPKCLLFHLKFIEIRFFEGYQEQLEVVEYFLKNAHVLDKLIVRTGVRMSTTKQLEISTKLLMLQRASAGCQIELLSHR